MLLHNCLLHVVVLVMVVLAQGSAAGVAAPSIAIGIPTVNRPGQLGRLLRQLTVDQGFPRENIFVFNDSDELAETMRTTDVAVRMGVNVVHHVVPRLSRLEPTAGRRSVRLAMTYKFMLESLLGQRSSSLQQQRQQEDEVEEFTHAIMIEDDLLLANDFVEYFTAMAGVMVMDESLASTSRPLFCVSAWNDNGFWVSAADEAVVRKAEHFMGLGWMISASIYHRVVHPRWPPARFFEENPFFPSQGFEWDDFFRLLFVEAARVNGTIFECAFPEVPRVFHTFAPATTSAHSTTEDLQRMRFETLSLAKGGGTFRGQAFAERARTLVGGAYDDELVRFLGRAQVVKSAAEIRDYQNQELVLLCERCPGEARETRKRSLNPEIRGMISWRENLGSLTGDTTVWSVEYIAGRCLSGG